MIKYQNYKPAYDFWNKLLNFVTNVRASQPNLRSYSDQLAEIDSTIAKLCMLT